METERTIGRLLGMALLLAAVPAQATLGNGIRVGGSDGRLHPFVELELRYDSNAVAFYQPVTSSTGDLVLHLRPGLLLTVPGDTVAVDLRAALDWAQYFGVSDGASKDLSSLFATVSLGVGFNRKGPIGLEIDERFARSNQPTAYSVSSGVISNYNDLAVKVPWMPGGGALTLAFTGGWSIESFESFKAYSPCDPAVNPFCDSQYLSDLGYSNVGLGLGVNWKFLPKTSALFDLSWFDRIPNSTLHSVEATGLRTQFGLTGLITPHLAGTLKAGYATTLSLKLDPAAGAVPADLGTWLATISAEWIPSPFSTLKLTWNHDLGVDPGTTYALYTANHVAVEGRSKFNSVLAGALTFDYAALSYRDLTKSRSTVITLKPALQAELSRWLLLELAYQYTDRSTDLAVPPPGWKYSRSEVWLKGVVTY